MPTNKIIHIRRLGIALAAAVALAPLVAQAQELYTTTPTIGGGSRTIGPNGWMATTTPTIGGGSTTSVFQPQPMLPTAPIVSPPVQPMRPLTTPSWGYR